MENIVVKPRLVEGEATLCLVVSRNGKLIGTAGVPGLGVVTASITASRTRKIDASGSSFAGPTTSSLDLSLNGSDVNDPKLDKFLVWADRRLPGDDRSKLRPGDKVEIQIVENAQPDPPLRTKQFERLPPEKLRSPLNPTRRVVGDVELWGRGSSILLKSWDKDANPAILTAAQARKIATALNALASKVERPRKARPGRSKRG